VCVCVCVCVCVYEPVLGDDRSLSVDESVIESASLILSEETILSPIWSIRFAFEDPMRLLVLRQLGAGGVIG